MTLSGAVCTRSCSPSASRWSWSAEPVVYESATRTPARSQNPWRVATSSGSVCKPLKQEMRTSPPAPSPARGGGEEASTAGGGGEGASSAREGGEDAAKPRGD